MEEKAEDGNRTQADTTEALFIQNTTLEVEKTAPGLPVFPPSPLSIFIVKILFSGLMLLVTFFGNLLVLVSYATTRRLRTYTNYYLVALAVADLVSGAVTPTLLNIPWLIGYWPFGAPICRVFVYLNTVFVHVTFLLTFIICVDRYRATRMPLKHLQEKNMRHALKMITPGFLLPSLLWMVMILILPEFRLFRPVPKYSCHLPYSSNRAAVLFTSLFATWIPIIGTSALYACIYFRVLRKKQLGDRAHPQSDAGLSSLRERNSASVVDSIDPVSVPDKNRSVARSLVYTNRYADDSRVADEAAEGTIVVGAQPPADETRNSSQMVAITKNERHKRRTPGDMLVFAHRKRLTSSRRATRTLAYIIGAMVVSSTPTFLYAVLVTAVPNFPTNPSITWLVTYAIHLSSAANPFLYAVCNPVFKQAFLHIICCCCRHARLHK